MKRSDILACFSVPFKVGVGNSAPWINPYIIYECFFQFVIHFMSFQSSKVLTLYQRMFAANV